MAQKNNRICIVCRKEYSYCGNCSEDRLKEPWHAIYHNANCKDIFNVASDYLAGAITKEEARKKFDDCDLSYKENLHYKILEAVNTVYGITEPNTEEKTTEVADEGTLATVKETESKKSYKKKVVFE